MDIPLLLQVILAVLSVVIVILSDWLALKIFRLKTTKANLAKIIGLEALLTVIAVFAGLKNTSATTVLSFLLLVADAGIWFVLLKRYAQARYSFGRALGSFAVSYGLILAFSLAAAMIMMVSFMQTFAINGDSMAPALRANDSVLVYKFQKHPVDNAIIVYETDTHRQALGRVHGTPGQSIALAAGRVVIAGKTVSTSSYNLGPKQYYVTADNASYNIPPRVIDSSRIIGTVGPKL